MRQRKYAETLKESMYREDKAYLLQSLHGIQSELDRIRGFLQMLESLPVIDYDKTDFDRNDYNELRSMFSGFEFKVNEKINKLSFGQ